MELLSRLTMTLILSCFLFSCEDQITNQGQLIETDSAIKVKPAFIPATELIGIQYPADGSSLPVDNNSFSIDKKNDYKVLVFMFDSPPEKERGFIKNFFQHCIAGATDLNLEYQQSRFTIQLSKNPASSNLYACKDDQFEPLDLSKKVDTTNSKFAAGSKIYFIALGFNNSYKITHSSSIRSFVSLP